MKVSVYIQVCIKWNTFIEVLLANHIRAVAGMFYPFKYLSVLFITWVVNFKYLSMLFNAWVALSLRWKLKLNIGTQAKCAKQLEQNFANEQDLETAHCSRIRNCPLL